MLTSEESESNICIVGNFIPIIFGVFNFFFQAQDAKLDAQESRGLGDVYKRQISALSATSSPLSLVSSLFFSVSSTSVSYTHLTLPTKRIV